MSATGSHRLFFLIVVATTEFNAIYDEIVAAPLVAIGAQQKGRRVFYEDRNLAAALFRTELRYQSPVKLTLVIRHRFLRDRQERIPEQPPTEPSDYPVKIAPSHAEAILSPQWRYQPHNLGRWPSDTIPYPQWSTAQLRAALTPIGECLEALLPDLCDLLTPQRMLEQLRANGEDAWCERLWIADLEAKVTST
jgi:hypothetical protein